MIPNELNEWNYELIKKLVSQGFFETDKFDFKEDSPHKKDEKGKDRLEKSVCAFANTEGGFLVFGIKDGTHSLKDKLSGIDPQRDFPREFGDKIINIEPNIYYEFKNPPIKLPHNSNFIHVVKIPQSPERPHRTTKGEFYFRTNRGNVPMSYQQIKDSFIGEEFRRQKLRLLYIELLTNKLQSGTMLVPDELFNKSYSLVTLDSNVLQTLLVDVYPFIIKNDDLIGLLIRIREDIRVINTQTKIFFSKISLPLSNQPQLVKEHNESMNKKVKELISFLSEAIKILEDEYGLKLES